jgi:hypothetical protein
VLLANGFASPDSQTQPETVPAAIAGALPAPRAATDDSRTNDDFGPPDAEDGHSAHKEEISS